MGKKIVKCFLEQATEALETAAYEYADIDFDASDFYCGITNDIKRRAREHNANFLISLNVVNVENAKQIEHVMKKKGFTTGKPANGASDDSIFVYLYAITPETNQLDD